MLSSLPVTLSLRGRAPRKCSWLIAATPVLPAGGLGAEPGPSSSAVPAAAVRPTRLLFEWLRPAPQQLPRAGFKLGSR